MSEKDRGSSEAAQVPKAQTWASGRARCMCTTGDNCPLLLGGPRGQRPVANGREPSIITLCNSVLQQQGGRRGRSRLLQTVMVGATHQHCHDGHLDVACCASASRGCLLRERIILCACLR